MASAAAAPSGVLEPTTVALDGAVYASPIVAGQVLVVSTENDSVYGLAATGALLWRVSLGTPTPQSVLPCGDIDPLGITGTPYYDKATDTVFLTASIGRSAGHQLVALAPADGTIRWRRSVDLPGVDQLAMQQRGALTVTDGMVWVPFGGLDGDCGNYRGRVVGVPVRDGTPVAFTVPTGREGGIWTPPGPAVLDGDLLVAVGNGESTGGAYDHSDSVLRLRGTHIVDSFSPAVWASDNASDLDLGAQGPAVVQGKWVFQAGKSGTAYVLAANHLGGIGGQVSKAQLCRSFGGAAVSADVVYVPCTDGLRAVQLTPSGTMKTLWRADTSITGSPVFAANRVYALDPDAGILAVLDAATGKELQQIHVGTANRFATPAISGGRIYVGTLAGLTIVGHTP
ncbi:MAG: PQQ-binding-like beta-propeller repeat protein [Mycobacterium sp.]